MRLSPGASDRCCEECNRAPAAACTSGYGSRRPSVTATSFPAQPSHSSQIKHNRNLLYITVRCKLTHQIIGKETRTWLLPDLHSLQPL